MAGGQGSRLRPLTCDRPKPMVPVCNEPVMAHILRLLARSGLNDVLVTLHPMPEVVQEYFGTGEDFRVRLGYLVEEQPLGTAGGIAQARRLVDDTLVVVSGDAFTDIDLAEAVRFHKSRGAAATLVLKAVCDPGEYGIVITDADGRIRRFLEKPGRGEVFSDHANAGIYVLEPRVLDRIEPGRPVDFSQDLFPALLAAGEPLYGWLAPSGYWSDIGTPEQYRQTHLDVMGAWPAEQAVRVGPGCRIAPTARLIPPCLLGPGCEVEDGAEVGPFACLGEGCHVGRGASVRHGVLWKGCWLGPGAEVRGAVLADGVVLGRAARVFEGAVLGRRCQVGEGAVVGPGVRLWPEKQVEEFDQLSRPVVWNGMALRSVVGPLGVRAEANAGLTPEAACGVGGAFAGRLAAGSRVVVAHSGSAAARALAWAAAAGVSSAGCHVSWLDAAPVGVARQAVRLAGQGGIYVSVGWTPTGLAGVAGASDRGGLGDPAGRRARGDEGDPEVARLLLWDARGLELGAREARSVDAAFRREEWRRAGAGGMGDMGSAFELRAQARSAYLLALRRWCQELVEAWAAAASRLLPAHSAACAEAAARPEQHPVAVKTQAPAEPNPAEALLVDALGACGLEVVSNPAPVPVLLVAGVNPSGEGLELFDPRGGPVSRAALEDLACLLDGLTASPGEKVPLPVWASDAVERALQRLGREPQRTAAHPAALAAGREQPWGHPLLDGIALACGLAALAARAGGLAPLVRAVSPRPRLRLELPVRRGRVGQVMRRLAREVDGPALAVDGLRVCHDRGWAVVRPDPDRPVVELRVEATTLEDARDLLAHYAELVRRSAEG